MKGSYFLSEYLLKENIKLQQGYINVINAPAGSGKTTFVFKELINNTHSYINYELAFPEIITNITKGYCFKSNLDKVIYVCDTKMLKDKTLEKYKNITTIFKDNFFKRAKTDELLLSKLRDGKITVMTYKQLGWCLGYNNIKNFIYDHIDLIIMDEFHNLFYYNNKFKTDKDHSYQNIIDKLPVLAMNHLLVCLTATTFYADTGIEQIKDTYAKALYRIILDKHNINEIRQYENKNYSKIINPVNNIKWLCLNKNKVDKLTIGNKVLIFAEKIKTCNRYKNMLLKSGYRVETLFTESKLNDKQKKLRNYLIEHERYPDDLDILIINKAYETGWDLKDNRIQFVIIDSYNPTIITQVRNRCRFDIEKLTSALKEPTKIPYPYESKDGFYRTYIEFTTNDGNRNYGYICDNYTIKFILEEKYIGYKLPKDKTELIETYGSYDERKQCNWTTFKDDLKRNGYYIKKINKGTYIFEEGKFEIIKDSKKEIKRVKEENKNNELENYLEELIGKKLFKEEQVKLIQKIDVRVDGKQQKTYKKINMGLEMLRLNYMILPKKSNNLRYWIVEKIDR